MNIMFKNANLKIRFKILFFFDVLLKIVFLTICSIFYFVIFDNEMQFKYTKFEYISRKSIVTKKIFFKNVLILFFRVMIIILSTRFKLKIVDVKKICRFFVHLINFQIFWTFFVVFVIAFRWFNRNIFLINRFFLFLNFSKNNMFFFSIFLFEIIVFW